jgi:uncharacterized protein (DUF2141 family)
VSVARPVDGSALALFGLYYKLVFIDRLGGVPVTPSILRSFVSLALGAVVVAALAPLMATPSWAKQAGSVEVTVRNLEPGKGVLYVSLCEKPQFLTGTCRAQQKLNVNAETMSVRLGPVPHGRYAISAWYDRNSNGKMETNRWGAPTEPTGNSRGAVGRMGPPKFEDAAFDLNISLMKQTVDVY